jgi:hypothetical protein
MRVELTPLDVAEQFAEMSDEEQAQVFIEVARIARTWMGTNMDQWYAVGGHLRTCSCSTPEARDMVRRIAEGVGSE